MGVIRHGIIHFKRTGDFHPSLRGRQRLRRELEQLRGNIRSAIPSLTPQKELLLNETMRIVGCLWLAGLYMSKVGIFREEELKEGILEPQPFVSSTLLALENSLRLNLLALGMNSKHADKVLTPFELVKEEERKEKLSPSAEKE